MELLISTLKQVHDVNSPVLLYSTSKIEGLFPKRNPTNQSIVEQCFRDGLLALDRQEVKGKNIQEWVRITPRGVRFLQEESSPRKAIEALANRLQLQENGMARWVVELKQQIQQLSNRLENYLIDQEKQLQQLKEQCTDALTRLTHSSGAFALHNASLRPWQLDLLNVLDQSHSAGTPLLYLDELFEQLRHNHADLTIPQFHEGILELRDRGRIELVTQPQRSVKPFPAEFALLDDVHLFHALKLTIKSPRSKPCNA